MKFMVYMIIGLIFMIFHTIVFKKEIIKSWEESNMDASVIIMIISVSIVTLGWPVVVGIDLAGLFIENGSD